MYTDDQIFKRLNEHKAYAESQGLTVYAVLLKGSQNYNLQDEDSDIDTNLIFIPTLQQLRNKATFKFPFDDGECTCHNIYAFAEIVAKGNPQWVEVCKTAYRVGESMEPFQHYRLNPSALKGMIMEKATAFSKLYPSRASVVEQFGYDPKQLHHIIRLYDCLQKNVDVYRYTEDERNLMLDIKRGRFPTSLEAAETLRDEYLSKLALIYDERKIAYQPQTVDYDLLDSIVMKFYKDMY